MPTGSRFAVLVLGTLVGSPAAAQGTRLVSVDSAEVLGDGYCSLPSISADGRYVAFQSSASNLVPSDDNNRDDVFVRDLASGTTEVVSVDSTGSVGNGHSRAPMISADGRFVAFQSLSTDLIPNDTAGVEDIFVHDRVAQTTERVNLTSTGGAPQVGASCYMASISADGRYVAFITSANNLVPGDTNGLWDVFVRDRVAGTTERVSVSTAGAEGDASCAEAAISADGRFVAFTSWASNLVPGDTDTRDVFVHDRVAHTTEKASVATGGWGASWDSYFGAISADGRFVAFATGAPNLVPGDTNNLQDAFLRDRLLGTTQRVSVNSGEGQSTDDTWPTSISANGRFVAMLSVAVNLVPGDLNLATDVFVRDLQNGTTERVSLDSDGAQGNGSSLSAVITPDGRWIAFSSGASNLVPGDTNGWTDVFLRDREATSFVITCEPGFPIAACPCSNPPVGSSRGCDNSAGTGGAALRGSGSARLSADSLLFTTSGEKPTALSIVLQGTAYVQAGLVYGQGLRCVGGSLKRLYAKSAVAGCITAPDFGAGDPTVSARSAAKGDVIQPGQPRWYMVYYRDNTILGGCPSTSTFNTTQTGMVSWSP